MPALAGLSRMPYRRFATWNFTGGNIWGALFVTLGFIAGNSYEELAHAVGRGAAVVVGVVVVVILGVWQVRKHRTAQNPQLTETLWKRGGNVQSLR